MKKLKPIIQNYIQPIWYLLCAILISYSFVNMVYNAYFNPKEPDTRDFDALESKLQQELSSALKDVNQRPFDNWSRFMPSSTYNVIMYKYKDLSNSNIIKIEDNLIELGWTPVFKKEKDISESKLDKEFEKKNMSISFYTNEDKDFSFFENNENRYEVFTLTIREVFDK